MGYYKRAPRCDECHMHKWSGRWLMDQYVCYDCYPMYYTELDMSLCDYWDKDKRKKYEQKKVKEK